MLLLTLYNLMTDSLTLASHNIAQNRVKIQQFPLAYFLEGKGEGVS